MFQYSRRNIDQKPLLSFINKKLTKEHPSHFPPFPRSCDSFNSISDESTSKYF